MEGGNEAPRDIENPCVLAASLSKELVDLPPSSDSCCIYRVPEQLRCANKKAYTPQVVSIGPLHHGKEGLKDMEEHKKRYLQHFLSRTEVSLEDCVRKIKGKEAKLRGCYAQTIELCSDEFVRIILVDAAFLIELLLRVGNHIMPDNNDRIFYKPWLINFIKPDLLLLENQLPFFILEDLFDADKIPVSSKGNSEITNTATAEVPPAKQSVLNLSCNFWKGSGISYAGKSNLESSSSLKVEHFVDLVRTLNLPTKEENFKNRGPIKTLDIPSMTKLHQVGVKFKVRSSKHLFNMCFPNQDGISKIPSNNLFDICFNDRDGTLKIPNITIGDDTELVLRNLIAFEQCHCDCNYFSDYIFLMDYFVNSPNDVELLVKNGIVENLLGDNTEVSTLINSLGKGVSLNKEEFYFATLSKNLNKYYRKPWNKWKADLKQKYFDTPWTTISVIAATLIIILTLIQTVWSIAR